jgi:hypothetical protein
MRNITISVPISCTDNKVKECCMKLYSSKNISTSTTGDLLNRRLTIYLPEADLKTEELLEIGIIIGVYIH